MDIAQKCDACGGGIPRWLVGMMHNKCHADYVRYTYVNQSVGHIIHHERIETAEPHTAEEYFRGYLDTGSLQHNYPARAT